MFYRVFSVFCVYLYILCDMGRAAWNKLDDDDCCCCCCCCWYSYCNYYTTTTICFCL